MAKKDKQTDAPSVQRDDALFETLGKNKKKTQGYLCADHFSIFLRRWPQTDKINLEKAFAYILKTTI